MQSVIRTEKRHRSTFGLLVKWAFIAFNVLMVVWLISGVSAISKMTIDSDAARAGQAIGTTIALSMILGIWTMGAIILGLFVLLTRGDTIITETAPNASYERVDAGPERSEPMPFAQRKISASKAVWILLAVGFGIFAVASHYLKSDPPRQQIATKPILQSEVLRNLRIGGFSWVKGGFGSVMTASFVIYNDNKFSIKDAIINCTHTANSGTKIDSNRRTVYERIEGGGNISVTDMNMGFIHSAVVSTTCLVVGFSRV